MLFKTFIYAALAFVQYSRADDLPDHVSRGGNSSSLSIELSNGDTRNYLLHVPRNYNKSSPVGLLWVYPGRNGDNGHAESFTQFSDPKYNPNMMVVYPQGTPDRSGEDVWQGDPNAKTDDISFTLELLDDLQKTYTIDEGRIYAAGQSNGGGFVANHLACDVDASRRFAAFGAVSAAYYQLNRRSCNADKVKIKCDNNGTKIALIDVHGGQDRTTEYAGGHRRRACLPSIPHFVTSWAERNGMNASNRTSEVYGGDAVHYSFGEAAADGMVQSYYVPTMGHVWASGSNGEVLRATDVLLEFFSRWTMERRDKAAATLPDTSGSIILRPTGFVALFVPATMAAIQLV
jgi:poly(3-hydroxybutyrate) depolymerase